MKNLIIRIFCISVLTILSCTQKPNYRQPNIDLSSVERDFKKWWTYQNSNILLSSDFIPIDVNSN